MSVRVLTICYYYDPSLEVASRRLRAMTAALQDMSLAVTVVSEFGGEPAPRLPAGVTAVPVAVPPKWLVAALVRCKSWLRQWQARAGTEAAGEGPSGGGAGAAAGQSRLTQRFFEFVEMIDARKRWAWRALRAARRSVRALPVDLVLASGPMHSGVIAAWRLARGLRVPLIVDFRDPMYAGSEDYSRAGAISAWLRRGFEACIVRDAALVLAASPGIAAALARQYPDAAARVHVIMNGFDGEAQPPRAATGGRLEMLFAGSLYFNRDPFPFLMALERLVSRADVDPSRVRLKLIGDCESYRGMRLADWLRGRDVERVVSILPAMPPAELAAHLASATLQVNFAQGQPRQIPAKTFEHIASGSELLALCEADSDTGRLLRGVPGARAVPPGDALALSGALWDYYQRHVLAGHSAPPPAEIVRQYSRHGQNLQFAALVRQVLAPKTVTGSALPAAGLPRE